MNVLLEFFKSNKFKIVIAIVAVLFGVMLYSAAADGMQNIPRNLLSMIITPFQKASAGFSNAVGEFFDVFFNAQDNADENVRLRAQVDELNKQLIEYEQLKDENVQLKEAIGIKEQHDDFEIEPAVVIGRDPADRYASFTIDRGSLHGISLNDPVMSSSGLIGYISELSPISARVRTILNPETNVSAFEITSNELGVVSGDTVLAHDGLCKLSILSEETKIENGFMMVTAGSSGLFPKGVPIGIVEQVSTESHGFTMYAAVRPLVDINHVVNVQVITNFVGQGSELIDYLE